MDEKLWLPRRLKMNYLNGDLKLHYEAGKESFPVTGKVCLLQGKAEMRDERILNKVYFKVIDL